MGMYDTIFCHYPLPGMEGDQSKRDFQTKSLRCDLDKYEIRQDGTLWHEAYDIEDRSDKTKPGFAGLVGCMTRVNCRWEECLHTGEVVFYDGEWEKNQDGSDKKTTQWYEFSAYFVNGKLKELHRIS